MIVPGVAMDLAGMRIGFGLCLAAMGLSCSSAGRVDRIYEDGVEVVLNHLEPYRLKDEPSTFDLETILTIDTEREDLAAAGMGSAGEYDIDGEGNICIVAFKNIRDFVYRFDARGSLLGGFGPYGQGPGEIEWPFLGRVFDDGRIALIDRLRKYIVFDKHGRVLRETRPGFSIFRIHELDAGDLLVYRDKPTGRETKENPYPPYSLSLCGPNFTERLELDRHQWDSGNERLPRVFMWRVSADHVYVANEQRGYEILDFDLAGRLRRKIRKDYRPVRITPEIRMARIGDWNPPGTGHYFPDPLPPLCSFFVDDEGRLFVMTYEAGDNPGEFIYDIFNDRGVFVGRKSLNLGRAQFWAQTSFSGAKAKNGLLYHYREKDSGYRELIVQKMVWRR